MSKLTNERIDELLRAESKLQALEAGGVDNWECYDESLEAWRKEIEREDTINSLIEDAINALEDGICDAAKVQYPVGWAAGPSIYWEDSSFITDIFNNFLKGYQEVSS